MTFPMPTFMPDVAAFPSLSYQTATASATDASSYSFSSQAIGTAAANRYVIVGICLRRSFDTTTTTITGVTVGGISATQAVTIGVAQAGAYHRGSLYIVNVPTGTTATVAITLNISATRLGIGVWSAYDISSSTPTDTATSTDVSSQTLDLDVDANGFAIGVNYANGAPALSWSGLTERFEQNVEDDNDMSGADSTETSAQTPLSVTATITSGNNVGFGCTASWR